MSERRMVRDPGRPAVVLVLGASSGIGRETALCFAGRGANLVLAARSEAALVQVAAACRVLGAADVLVCPTDVGDADQVERTVAAAVRRIDRLDVVVNAAAVAIFGTFVDVPREMFDAVLRTNVINALLPAVSDAVVGPAMRLGGFTRRLVVAATSGNVLAPAPAAPEYSYAGRGVDGRSRGL